MSLLESPDEEAALWWDRPPSRIKQGRRTPERDPQPPEPRARGGLSHDLHGRGKGPCPLAGHQPFHNPPRSNTKLGRYAVSTDRFSLRHVVPEREQPADAGEVPERSLELHVARESGDLTWAIPDAVSGQWFTASFTWRVRTVESPLAEYYSFCTVSVKWFFGRALFTMRGRMLIATCVIDGGGVYAGPSALSQLKIRVGGFGDLEMMRATRRCPMRRSISCG